MKSASLDDAEIKESCILTIIVSVFNTANNLRNTLESMHCQTIDSLEIICIDDCSTDGSVEIIQEYVNKDSRFRAIYHETNLGTHSVRLEGMAEACGKYVWLIDGDDTLVKGSLGQLSNILQKNDYDIIHVGTRVLNDNHLDEQRVTNMQRFTEPYMGKLSGDKIFTECFINNKYQFNIWNKIFHRDLLRRALPDIEQGRFPKAQDKYEYYVLSSHAKSYLGIPNLIAYEYHFGSGITGHDTISLELFSKYCSMKRVDEAIENYSSRRAGFFVEAGKISRGQLLNDCVANWYRLPVKDRSCGFDEMVEAWGACEIISALANRNWFRQDMIAESISDSKYFHAPCRKPKVIATYYHRINNGGIQRVVSSLTKLWVDMGYEVVLITDEKPSENDYPIDTAVKRAFVPKYSDITKNTYNIRAEALSKILQEYKIDLFINHAWVVNTLLWDTLVCKTQNVGVITHCHNIFAMLENNGYSYFSALPSIYSLMDGVVVLSKVDYKYWSNFNRNIHLVQNPMTFDPTHIPQADLNSQNIIWVGRIAPEKRPEEAITIFEKIHKRNPNAKLIMVGSGKPDYMEHLKKLASEKSLNESIEFKGFLEDLSEIYQNASVFLSTSEFEGYYISLIESLSFGVPAVIYDLPYLTAVREGDGFIVVEQSNCNTASTEVCSLLNDEQYRKDLGNKGRAYAKKLSETNLLLMWDNIFGSLSELHPPINDEDSKIMWDTLMKFYRNGINKKNYETTFIKKTVSYRMGRILTYIPRRLLDRRK